MNEPQAFLDRFGAAHLSHLSALKFARAFAAAEPEPVMHYIEEAEDKLRAEGYLPGHRSSHSILRELRPGHALVRQWAGAGEVGLLRDQIQRLQKIILRAIAELRAAGKTGLANSLERELRGR
ncbi:hypothetical protein EUA98_10765 [Pengzhenrongella frigida]|uniref:Uncharacterized protein n=2 Tax=Pengzhenrongella frigida TaxID=1259133 RepID=A0A4Q5N4Q1_9MICO|nr:hypothetical protein EUA98_10765 [Cellulomonas sp. HLT2-17]